MPDFSYLKWRILTCPSLAGFGCPLTEESQDNDIPWEDQSILKAVVSKISKNRAIIEEFVHTYYKEKSNDNIELDSILQDDAYQQLCIEEPELEVVLPDKKHGPSLSEVLAAIELDDSSNAPNWENRGLGKLLLERLEKWARRARIRALYGFLSSRDDIEKLKNGESGYSANPSQNCAATRMLWE